MMSIADAWELSDVWNKYAPKDEHGHISDELYVLFEETKNIIDEVIQHTKNSDSLKREIARTIADAHGMDYESVLATLKSVEYR